MSSGFVFALITAILGEAGLSFIGLGVYGTQTWGSMLFYAQNAQALTLGWWWSCVTPRPMISLLCYGQSLINSNTNVFHRTRHLNATTSTTTQQQTTYSTA